MVLEGLSFVFGNSGIEGDQARAEQVKQMLLERGSDVEMSQLQQALELVADRPFYLEQHPIFSFFSEQKRSNSLNLETAEDMQGILRDLPDDIAAFDLLYPAKYRMYRPDQDNDILEQWDNYYSSLPSRLKRVVSMVFRKTMKSVEGEINLNEENYQLSDQKVVLKIGHLRDLHSKVSSKYKDTPYYTVGAAFTALAFVRNFNPLMYSQSASFEQ